MKAVRCIIVDDEPLARKGLLEYSGHVDFLNVVGVFENARQAYSVIDELDPDLIFLDIEMPRLSGMDFLRSLKVQPLVIITTAYHEYAVEGYELDVIDYLLKPIPLPRFLKAVNKVRDIIHSQQLAGTLTEKKEDHFFIKENGRFIRIAYDELLYVEGLQNYVAIHLQDRKLIAYMTMTMLEQQLPAARFMRIHKSYIVALDKVHSIDGHLLKIGRSEIPVSRKLKEEVLQRTLSKTLIRRKSL